ncbi:MAG: hypothetical protein JRI79_05115 [Deltaproteobacteria bacterium]|nr:hypothetical protein [Deltaproteobacteria bacterium]MBW1921793.1 hypothetical protein [Deltaproteobacteria bacterium]MBW1934706.1 hypothetical protein [Deltaproteobacteria bacterium]MBW1977337.1 hypothetical protein [Deltaproteobacteria bacterium]MBW2043973.1 hypothetical protein [Deltaproteobacteria bacterium]
MKNLFDRLKYRRNALDQFVMAAPDPKNMVDIFKGEWVSVFGIQRHSYRL